MNKVDHNYLYDKLQQQMRLSSEYTQASALKLLKLLGPVNRPTRCGFSVVDFGCGQSDWLKAAERLGATRLLGLETYGHANANPKNFEIRFVDLEQPVALNEHFDIALCMEVAEHLKPSAAESLVKSLCACAGRIIFSAAVPGQGGVFHLNEQPPVYWQRLFRQYGKVCIDKRQTFWNDGEISPWYRQNVLLFVDEPAVRPEEQPFIVSQPSHLIHPDIFSVYAASNEHVIFYYENKNLRADRIAL